MEIQKNSDGRLIINVSRNLGPNNPFFKTEAEKKAKVLKTQDASLPENLGFSNLKEGELLDVDKQMNKFKQDLEKIVNVKPQNENTNLEKIISESSDLKENSEFEFKSEEKKQ